MPKVVYTEKAIVEIFPQKGGWTFVRVPVKYSHMFQDIASKERGLVAITACVGKETWNTSLLPMGDKTHFIALPAKVRAKEKILAGQKVTVSFFLRNRW